MEKIIHRRIVISSIVVVFVALAGRSLGFIFPDEHLITLSYVAFGLSIISMLSSYAIIFKEEKWIRKTMKYSAFLIPLLIILSFLCIFLITSDSILIISVIGIILITLILMMHVFLLSNATSLTGNLVLMAFMIVGIIFKRNHFPLAGWIITLGSVTLGIGNFMYGIRSLYLADKINYLKYSVFSGGCILAIAFLGQLFKLQHWNGAGSLVIIGFASLIIGSMYILLTLHSSGIIDWQPFYKKILLQILLPWIFIFILYISRYMVPELNRLIWTPGSNTDKTIAPYGFGMSDYTIENKNGIDPK